MKFPYNLSMGRLILAASIVATALAVPAVAEKPPAVFESSKLQSEVVACLADQIRQFDNSSVAPSANGTVSITTHVMHVTRIDILVRGGTSTKVEVKNRVKGKLKKIVEGCL